eukprot:230887-Chlamydomonas_euryale.AAC.3
MHYSSAAVASACCVLASRCSCQCVISACPRRGGKPLRRVCRRRGGKPLRRVCRHRGDKPLRRVCPCHGGKPLRRVCRRRGDKPLRRVCPASAWITPTVRDRWRTAAHRSTDKPKVCPLPVTPLPMTLISVTVIPVTLIPVTLIPFTLWLGSQSLRRGMSGWTLPDPL